MVRQKQFFKKLKRDEEELLQMLNKKINSKQTEIDLMASYNKSGGKQRSYSESEEEYKRACMENFEKNLRKEEVTKSGQDDSILNSIVTKHRQINGGNVGGKMSVNVGGKISGNASVGGMNTNVKSQSFTKAFSNPPLARENTNESYSSSKKTLGANLNSDSNNNSSSNNNTNNSSFQLQSSIASQRLNATAATSTAASSSAATTAVDGSNPNVIITDKAIYMLVPEGTNTASAEFTSAAEAHRSKQIQQQSLSTATTTTKSERASSRTGKSTDALESISAITATAASKPSTSVTETTTITETTSGIDNKFNDESTTDEDKEEKGKGKVSLLISTPFYSMGSGNGSNSNDNNNSNQNSSSSRFETKIESSSTSSSNRSNLSNLLSLNSLDSYKARKQSVGDGQKDKDSAEMKKKQEDEKKKVEEREKEEERKVEEKKKKKEEEKKAKKKKDEEDKKRKEEEEERVSRAARAEIIEKKSMDDKKSAESLEEQKTEAFQQSVSPSFSIRRIAAKTLSTSSTSPASAASSASSSAAASSTTSSSMVTAKSRTSSTASSKTDVVLTSQKEVYTMLMSKAKAQLEKQNADFEQLHKDEDDILDKIKGLIKAKDDKFALQDGMLLLEGDAAAAGSSVGENVDVEIMQLEEDDDEDEESLRQLANEMDTEEKELQEASFRSDKMLQEHSQQQEHQEQQLHLQQERQGASSSARRRTTGDAASTSTSTQLQAKALYTFTPQNPREVHFPKGAVVSIIRVVDDNWFEGTFEGNFGLIPRSYVEILVVGAGGGGVGGDVEDARGDAADGRISVEKGPLSPNASSTSTVTQFQVRV